MARISAPTGVTAAAARTQIYLTWTPTVPPNPTSYNVKRSTTPGGPYSTIPVGVTMTYFVDTGLTSGTTYYYVVTEVTNVESPASSEVSATPSANAAPDAPTGLTAAPGNAQVSLSWTASIGATSYSVERSTASGGPYSVVGSPAANAFTDTGVSNNQTYYYVVCAVSGAGSGPPSTEASARPAQPPTAPTQVTATAGYAGISLSWQRPAGATSFNVKRSTTSGGPYTTVASPTSPLATILYSDPGLTNGTTYYYVVSAVGSSVEGSNSSQVSATPGSSLAPVAPWGLTGTGINTAIVLTWTATPGATSYKVKRATSANGTTTVVGTPSSATFTDTGLNNANTYWYVVSAVDSGGEGLNSSQISAQPVASPVAPTTPQATAGYGIVSLTWHQQGGVTFNLKRSTTNGGPYSSIASGLTSPSYADGSVSNGTTYYYVVSAVNAGGESPNSTQVTATPSTSLPPGGPAGLVASPGNAQVTLSWSASTGATSYNVKNGAGSQGPFTTIASGITATSYTNTGLVNGQTHWYVVSAVDSGGEGPNSVAVSGMPVAPPTAPQSVTATAGYTEVLIAWTAPPNASSYTVRRSTQSGGPYTVVATGFAGTAYSDRALSNGTAYFYVVCATDPGGDSPNSNEVSATPVATLPPGPPIGLSANPGNTQIAFTWVAAAGAQSYSLQSGHSGSYQVVASNIVGTTYTLSGLVNGHTDDYVVFAVNSAGNGPNSIVVTSAATATAPPAPPSSISAVPGNTQAAVSWSPSSGATSYNVKQSTVSGGPYTTVSSPTGTSYTVTGLSNDQTYYFIVTAVNAGGESGNSAEATSIYYATPAAPSGLAATAGNTQVSLIWSGSLGATSYNVKRSTTSGGPYSTITSAPGPSFLDTPATGLVANTTYYYVVTALNSAGESGASGQASATPLAPPPAPTNLVAIPGNAQVYLSWTASPTATSYAIYWSLTTGGPYQPTIFPTGTSGTVQAPNNVTYYYVVRAENSTGESGNSNEVSAMAIPPPLAPTGLSAVGSDATVALSWTASAGATSYNVKRATSSGGPYTYVTSVATTSYTDGGLANGSPLYYVVTAVNTSGESGNSNEARGVPLPPITLTSMTPGSGDQGTKVMVTGSNLSFPNLTTRIVCTSGIDVVDFVSVSATQIVFILPPGTQTGPLYVQVESVQSNALNFTIVPSYNTPVPAGAVAFLNGFPIFSTTDLILSLGDFTSYTDAQSLAQAQGAQVVGYLAASNTYTFRYNTANLSDLLVKLDALETAPGVSEPSLRVALQPRCQESSTTAVYGNDLFDGRTGVWGWDRCQAVGAWRALKGATMSPVLVAIWDSGLFAAQYEFSIGPGAPLLYQLDTSGMLTGYSGTDVNGHGTAMAGIIAAAANNIRLDGVMSVEGGPSHSLLVLPTTAVPGDLSGVAFVDTLLNHIDLAGRRGAKVMNVSQGLSVALLVQGLTANGVAAAEAQTRATLYITRCLNKFRSEMTYKSILVCVAAGNDETNLDTTVDLFGSLNRTAAPMPNVIVVGAIQEDDNRWTEAAGGGSNYSAGTTMIDLAAPGRHIVVPYIPGRQASDRVTRVMQVPNAGTPANAVYALISGTSPATAFVTGAAGLLFSVNSQLKAADVKQLLVNNALQMHVDIPGGGKVSWNTLKIADAVAALRGSQAASWSRVYASAYVNGDQVPSLARLKTVSRSGQVFTATDLATYVSANTDFWLAANGRSIVATDYQNTYTDIVTYAVGADGSGAKTVLAHNDGGTVDCTPNPSGSKNYLLWPAAQPSQGVFYFTSQNFVCNNQAAYDIYFRDSTVAGHTGGTYPITQIVPANVTIHTQTVKGAAKGYSTPFTMSYPAPTPDNRWVFFSTATEKYLYMAAAPEATLTTPGLIPGSVNQATSTASSFAVVADENSDAPLQNVASRPGPVVSPDGSRVVYFNTSTGTLNVAFLTIDSGSRCVISSWTFSRQVDLQIQPSALDGQPFDWSPDGSFIVYVVSGELRTILAAGGELSSSGVPSPNRLASITSSSGGVVRWAWKE